MTWTAQTSNFADLSIDDRAPLLPPFLREILYRAETYLKPRKVWLYGSRARGDARENSDFDLAFEISDDTNWSRFVTEVSDDPPSLHKFDLVNYEQTDASLREAIHKEGLVIYERR